MYATAYAVTRHYGGPEEGGWWYNHYQRLESIPMMNESPEAIRKHLRKRWEDREHGNIYSVLGGTQVQVITNENVAGENETTEKPRYE